MCHQIVNQGRHGNLECVIRLLCEICGGSTELITPDKEVSPLLKQPRTAVAVLNWSPGITDDALGEDGVFKAVPGRRTKYFFGTIDVFATWLKLVPTLQTNKILIL